MKKDKGKNEIKKLTKDQIKEALKINKKTILHLGTTDGKEKTGRD